MSIDTTFRKFDQTDWDCFSGCESTNPLINDNNENVHVVIDGRTVCVNVMLKEFGAPPEQHHDIEMFQKEFPTTQLAMDFAQLALHVTEFRTFEQLFGESVGTM